MVLHCLDHHFVLERGLGYLHPAGFAYCWVWHISIASDFIRGIYNHHSLIIREDAGCFPEHGCLSNTWTAQNQQAPPAFDQILHNIRRSIYRPSYSTSQANDLSHPVAYGSDPMQRSSQSCPIVSIKISNAIDHILDFTLGDFIPGKLQL
jgi:hypothetical protein